MKEHVQDKFDKSGNDLWLGLKDRFVKENPGPFRAEDLIDWAIENGLADEPRIHPRRIMTQKLKRAFRSARIRDKQGFIVREMLPAKIERADENGNLIFDLVWDHIHEMSLDHAFMAFDQRDENISKQKKSATRDLKSCLKNNPNVQGHELQFQFGFMTEEPQEQVVDELKESKISQKRPR